EDAVALTVGPSDVDDPALLRPPRALKAPPGIELVVLSSRDGEESGPVSIEAFARVGLDDESAGSAPARLGVVSEDGSDFVARRSGLPSIRRQVGGPSQSGEIEEECPLVGVSFHVSAIPHKGRFAPSLAPIWIEQRDRARGQGRAAPAHAAHTIPSSESRTRWYTPHKQAGATKKMGSHERLALVCVRDGAVRRVSLCHPASAAYAPAIGNIWHRSRSGTSPDLRRSLRFS